MNPIQISCAGEVMVELAADAGSGLYRQGLAGDSYNTAIYLARAGLAVDYLTQLGDDAYSDAIIAQLQEEGIGCTRIKRIAGRQPGLYIIRNDATGERQFSYWRESSPARQMFDEAVALPKCDSFYFTGVTLAITRSGLDNLLALLAQLQNRGCQVIFDPNYRPQLWRDQAQAQDHYRAVLPYCDTVMPTLDDEQALWGITTVDQCRDLYKPYSVTELVVKAPQLLTHVFCGGHYFEQQAKAVAAVDTTGAGDSFNAAYIAARCRGESVERALSQGQQLAAAVVQHRGAVLPRSSTQLKGK